MTLHADLAYTYAYIRLERELPSCSVFHSLARTQHDVVPTVHILADAAGLDEEQSLLLRTAAWFQDIGRIEQSDDHRLRSAQIAADVLPIFGYGVDQVSLIADVILSTRMSQVPKTELEAIIADADCAWFGQPDYIEQSLRLRMELGNTGVVHSDLAWLEQQVSWLQSHQYHTAMAREYYSEQKQANLLMLQERIAQILLTSIGSTHAQQQATTHPLSYLWRANTRPDISLKVRERGAINS